MKNELNHKEIDQTKKASIAEGSAASLMLGFGEQYVVPFALRLGASSGQIGLLSSIPSFLGSLFQLLSAKITDKYENRKRIVLTFVLLQALTFIPLFILPVITKNFWVLAIIFTIYLSFGNIAAPAWSSWLGDVIPMNERSKYFSLRNRITIIFLFSSVLISGLILNFLEDNIWVGFGILFLMAFIGRFISFILFFKHKEPTYQSEIFSNNGFKDFVLELRKNAFGRFVIFRSSLSFAVMIASPFFAVLMLKVFNFTYLQFSVIVLAPMIIKALTMTYWGRLSHHFGNKNILRVTAILIGIIPINWLIATLLFKNNTLFIAILIIEMTSGFSWAGMELTTFNYMLDASSPKRRVKLFAYYNVIFNFLILLGGLIGSFSVMILTKQTNILTALIIVITTSGILRLIIAITATPKVKEIQNHEKVEDRRLFYEILVHRPLGFAVSSATSSMAFIENTVKKITKKK
ncbi:MFS transporter [Candidatus Woesearchaeota archaeon]|nr:MFS transporter [Candidatus Woesearchaeota archaeon]